MPNPNPTFKALSDLATQLNGAVLMGHSQGGPYPLAAALLNPAAAKGLVLIEPGRCPADYTDEQIKTLAAIPVLAVFGDHRDTPTGISTRPSWKLSFEGCQQLIDRLKAAGGQAEMLDPAARGIKGNSHMIMQDKNHLQIADLILKWIDERVSKRAAGRKLTSEADMKPFTAMLTTLALLAPASTEAQTMLISRGGLAPSGRHRRRTSRVAFGSRCCSRHSIRPTPAADPSRSSPAPGPRGTRIPEGRSSSSRPARAASSSGAAPSRRFGPETW